MNEAGDSYGKFKITLKLMFNQSVCFGFELLYGLLARFFVSLIICSYSLCCVLSDEYTELTFVMSRSLSVFTNYLQTYIVSFSITSAVCRTYSTQGYSYSRHMQNIMREVIWSLKMNSFVLCTEQLHATWDEEMRISHCYSYSYFQKNPQIQGFPE